MLGQQKSRPNIFIKRCWISRDPVKGYYTVGHLKVIESRATYAALLICF